MNNQTERKRNNQLFRFSETDEILIAMAKKAAVRFMNSYGEGRGPAGIVSNYESYVTKSLKLDDPEKVEIIIKRKKK